MLSTGKFPVHEPGERPARPHLERPAHDIARRENRHPAHGRVQPCRFPHRVQRGKRRDAREEEPRGTHGYPDGDLDQGKPGRADEVARPRAVRGHAQHRPACRHQVDAVGRGPRPDDRQGLRRGPGQDVDAEARSGRTQDHRHPRQARHGAGESLPAGARDVDELPQRGGGRGAHDPARPRRPEVARRAGPPDRDPVEVQPGGAGRGGCLGIPPGNDRLRRIGVRRAARGPDRLAHRDQRHRPICASRWPSPAGSHPETSRRGSSRRAETSRRNCLPPFAT